MTMCLRGLFVAAALTLAACGQNETANNGAGGARTEMVLNRGNGAEPGSLDPHLAQGTWENNIIGDLIMGLATEDARGEPIPGAAESWETSEDGLTWTFHLRDHQWSDGMPVTAEDFLYAWRRILDPKMAAPYAYFMYPVKNAEAVNKGAMPLTALGASAPDARTLVVQLEHPAPYLVQFMTHYVSFPVPKHVVETTANQWTRAGNYVGNGAYTLRDWVQNESVTLVKNPRFYDAANVAVDRVVFHMTQDYDAGVRRFRAGEVDTQSRMSAIQVDLIRANMPEVWDPVPVLSIEYYAVNQGRPAFKDVRVREALNLALNRELISDTVRKLGEPPAYSFVPPTTANFPGGNALAFKSMLPAERVKRAQDLMRQAGYGPDKPLKTSVLIRSTSADARRVPAAVQQMWREIYVDAEIVQIDTAVFYDRVQAPRSDFDIAEAGWRADFNDAASFLNILKSNSSDNYGQYKSAAFDALMNQADVERDLMRRSELMKQAEAVALKDFAMVPRSFWVSTQLVRPYVKNYVVNSLELNRTRWLSVDEAARAETLRR